MPWWGKKRRAAVAPAYSLDEFVSDKDGRDSSPLELGTAKDWQARLSALTEQPAGPRDLSLPAFTLIKGGDLFEAPRTKRTRTSDDLLSKYVDERIRQNPNGAAKEERETALKGVLRVVSGNPAVCRRMLLAKPVELHIIPQGEDYRSFGFPRSTNPRACGIFFNGRKHETALLGLREELICEKDYLMVHEMMHAVHLIGMTKHERKQIDEFLMPVYRSRTWVEEAVAIYAERAFAAVYTEDELNAPGLYGKTRRDWTDQAVFSLFMEELLRPGMVDPSLERKRRP